MPNSIASTDVLIVDDNADHRKFFVAALVRDGITTEQAESGQAALRRLRQKSFRLVVSDVEMKDGDGIWLLSQIQNEMPSMPVILISAGSIDRRTAFDHGALDCLLKPCPLAVFRKTVRVALEEISHSLKN